MDVDPGLLNHVYRRLTSGEDPAAICSSLEKTGWESCHIQAALKQARKALNTYGNNAPAFGPSFTLQSDRPAHKAAVEGRINVYQYLVALATLCVIDGAALAVHRAGGRWIQHSEQTMMSFFAIVVALVLINVIFLTSVCIRRLHDLNHSGWWAVLLAVPFVNMILLVYLFRPGGTQENRFGHNPKCRPLVSALFR